MAPEELRMREHERKKKYAGRCLDCGGPTNGHNGRANAPKYCRNCSPRHRLRAGPRGPSPEEIIEAMHDWERVHGRPPKCLDWIYAGVGPCTSEKVKRVFGSWNDAMIAAGYTPRVQGRPRKPSPDQRSLTLSGSAGT